MTRSSSSRRSPTLAGPQLNSVTRDPAGRTTGQQWTFPSATTITDQVTRSQSGRIVQHTTTRGATVHTAKYGYDTAGRLVTATIPGHQLTYQFAGTGGCGTNTAAGASGNRTGLIDVYTAPGQAAVTTSTAYCYDWADRLTGSTVTNPVTGANTVADGITPAEIGYDVRGNITRLADMVFTYDAANRHVGTTYNDGTTVTLTRDATGRVVSRTVDPAGAPPAVTTTYLHAGGADAAWGQQTGGALTRLITLPGGVTVSATATGNTFAYPSLQGHTLVTGNGTTTDQTGVLLYDPYGQPLHATTLAIGTTTADDQITNDRTGWYQSALKISDTAGSTMIVEMGARVYIPGLGRFTQIDPIEGGVDNDYVWPTDPIGKNDLTGKFALPLIPVLAIIIAVVLIVAVYVLAKNPPRLPSVSISLPTLPTTQARPSERSISRSVVIPKPQPTTYRANYTYRVYEIKAVGSNETWKYGITSGAPWEARPASQYSACEQYFGAECTHTWRATTTGYYNARVIEYGYILNYTMLVGSCPPGQFESCK